MTRALALCLALIAAPAAAQEATSAPAGILRVLDKITGVVTDVEFRAGETREIGNLIITMAECRYPSNNPSGDAYEALTILYRDSVTPVFRGWMIASAPALNPMDHPRYDVWPLRCITS
jgi:hypothetical protein